MNTLKIKHAIIISLFFSGNALAFSVDDNFPKFDKNPTAEIVHYERNIIHNAGKIYLIPGTSFDLFNPYQTDHTLAASVILGKYGENLAKASMEEVNKNYVENTIARLPKLDEIFLANLQTRIPPPINVNIEIMERAEGRPRLQFTPHGFLSLEKDNLVKAAFYVNAKALTETDEIVWRTTYLYTSTAQRPLTGLGGWVKNDSGSALEAESQQAMGNIIKAIAWDLSASSQKGSYKEVKPKGCLADNKGPIYLIQETPELWIFKRDGSKSYGSTTFIFDKVSCSL